VLSSPDDEGVREALRRSARVAIDRLSAGHEAPKLVGRIVAAGPSLRAPLSGRRCVYWEVHRNGARVEHGGQELLLRDATGVARVRLDAGVRVCVFRTVFSFGDAAHEGEGVLREGDWVAVSGRLAFEAIAANGTTYRERAPRRPLLTATLIAKDGTVMD